MKWQAGDTAEHHTDVERLDSTSFTGLGHAELKLNSWIWTDRKNCPFNELSDPVEESELRQWLHDDEEACEEDEGGPLNPREDVVHLQLVGQDLQGKKSLISG